MENNEITNYEGFGGTNTGFTDIRCSVPTGELIQLANWAKFRGILDIIMGALCCLGIVTAVFGIPLLIGGIKVLDSVSALKQAIKTDNHEKMTDFFMNQKKFFVFNGVSNIIYIALSLLALIISFGIFAMFLREFITDPKITDFFNPEYFSSF
jgi:hypothetical protein